MLIELARHHRGQHVSAAHYDGGSRLIAARFDPKNHR
jgi:hypothetical protein